MICIKKESKLPIVLIRSKTEMDETEIEQYFAISLLLLTVLSSKYVLLFNQDKNISIA